MAVHIVEVGVYRPFGFYSYIQYTVRKNQTIQVETSAISRWTVQGLKTLIHDSQFPQSVWKMLFVNIYFNFSQPYLKIRIILFFTGLMDTF